MNYLIMLRGPPGAGKSTISAYLCENIKGNNVVINKDILMYHFNTNHGFPAPELIQEMTSFLLRNSFNVIVEGCYGGPNSQKRIDGLRKVASDNEKIFILFTLVSNKETSIKRNEKRGTPISQEKVDKWYKHFFNSDAENGNLLETDKISLKELKNKIIDIIGDY